MRASPRLTPSPIPSASASAMTFVTWFELVKIATSAAPAAIAFNAARNGARSAGSVHL